MHSIEFDNTVNEFCRRCGCYSEKLCVGYEVPRLAITIIEWLANGNHLHCGKATSQTIGGHCQQPSKKEGIKQY